MNDQNPDQAEEAQADLLDDGIPTRGYHMLPLVGLGGSMGSIEALKTFFRAMPTSPGMAFVVVIHLSADFASSLAEALQRCTSMTVTRVEELTAVEVNRVYVIPPGKSLKAVDGHLQLGEQQSERGRHVAVDLFFRTLADTHGPHAAAVVLSGADGDGAIGIKRIKERGGLTIAQDPDDAEHSGMPRSAIATGMVDWVLPVAEMPARLLSYYKLEASLRLPSEEAPPMPETPRGGESPNDEAALRDVLTFLRTRTGRDFSYYKRATILRRIGRRMQVNGIEDLQGYLGCLRTRPGESGALLQDLLISVTNFFRDPDCFEALEQKIPQLFANKGPNDSVRVWVAACATGEEAYSVAMLLSEQARTMDTPPLVQIFATDLDEDAIRAAREGIYPSAIEADVSEERLRRFFVKEHRGYRVRRELREMVLFAMHDVLKDSPFSRLDLVTCRNLLIYLNRDAQARAFDIFHFALLPTGRLFLGSSESVEDGSQLFSVLDKKHRLYIQRPTPRAGLPVPSGPGTLALALEAQRNASEGPVLAGTAFENASEANRLARPIEGRQTSWSELHLRLLEQLAPPSILVDSEYEIVHLSASAGRFLQYSGGEPSRNLLRAVNPSLRIELRAALYHASQTKARAEVAGIPVELGSESLAITLQVTPVNEIGADLYLVVMQAQAPRRDEDVPEGAAPRAESDPVARHLDRELERLKSHLRDTVEQYEASTEELKASNEELQAMNEELRSATEELETSREELQSINEELTTVNHELKSKVDELGHANSDMHNLMDATAIATVFLDRELRITRYTPSAVTLFNLIPTDVGRPLTDLTSHLRYPELGEDAQRVLERLVPIEREVGQSDGSWHLARLLPYRTIEDRIAGVVLSFVNITERKQAEEVRLWLSAVVTSSSDAIISFSLDRTILSWNGGAERIFGYTAEEAIGQPLSMLVPSGGSDADVPASPSARPKLAAAAHDFGTVETLRRRKDGTDIHVSLTVSPIRDDNGNVMASTATLRDISAAKQADEALRDSREQLRLVIENAREFAIFSTDLDRRITTWNAGAQRLLGYSEDEAVSQPADMIFVPEDRAANAPEREAQIALQEGRASDDRFHLRKDGTRFWAGGAMMLMRDAAGHAVGFVKILRDQTAARVAHETVERSQAELRRALADAQSARRELESADETKDRFLAILSHELRNPLASIASSAMVMTSMGDSSGSSGTVGPNGTSDATSDRARAAEVIVRQSAAMGALLDDLLDVSRLRLGRLSMERRPTSISAVIQAAVEAARPAMATAGHQLIVHLPAHDLEVHGDPKRLAQVVINLLTNAAKYTPHGGHVTVSAELVEGQVVTTIADDGIGMEPTNIERMFDMFTQASTASNGSSGLGIGLALARSILDNHDGWIEAHSEGPGRGSQFRFGLPLLRANPSYNGAAGVAEPSPTQRGGTPKSVLVVDDNPDAAWGMAKLLELAGYRVFIADSGEKGLDLAQAHRPDVALLDIGMPEMDGRALAQKLRATDGGKQLLLVATTGWGQEDDVRRSLEAGFDAHMVKPVSIVNLRRLIEDHAARQTG